MKLNSICTLVVIALLSVTAGNAIAGVTLNTVKKRGYVRCGVSSGLAGFSAPDSKGIWKGLDVDVCHAIAAAVFGDKNKIKVTGLSAQQRFTALQSGEVDILTRKYYLYVVSRHFSRTQLCTGELL